MSYQPAQIVEKGGQKKARTIDEDVLEVMKEVLDTLRRMEEHMKLISGENITQLDVSDKE